MISNLTKDTKLKTREIAELSILCALMFIGKESMRMIPNVHPVAVIIILCTLIYGWKALYPTVIFVLLEIAIYGLGIWNIMYLYIWPLLVVISMPLRKEICWTNCAIVAGIFGLAFGALCSIPYIFLSGFESATSFWIAGIPFDVIHGISNFIITLFLLPVLYKTINRNRIKS